MVNGPDGLVPKLDARGKPVFCQPELWPIDNRIGGMPNPNSVGPALHQIASEGGWLPAVHSIEPNPLTYLLDKGRINVFNVDTPSLFMGPAERADVVVDFSQYAGKTLIVYNDSGAPIPAGDPRNDVFTGVGDQSGAGGAEDTKPGYGPNNRTVMQIKVRALPAGTAAPTAFETDGRLAALQDRVKKAFFQDQEKPVVAQPAYSGFDAAWEGLTQDQSYGRIQTGSLKEPVFKYTPGEPSTSINSVKVTTEGAGYVNAPTVTLSAPAAADGRAATAVATLKIDQLTLVDDGTGVGVGGTGYTLAPTVSIVGGGGNGATADAFLGVKTVTVTAGGTGYLVAPTVTFSAPPVGGRRATGTAVLGTGVNANKVVGVTITDAGTGYVGTPMVSFTPVSGGTGARATTTGKVTEVRLTPADPQNPASAGGGGYVSFDPAAQVNPFTLNFVGGGGTGAAAEATGKVFDITLSYAGRGYAPNEVPTVTVGAPPNGGVRAVAASDLAVGAAAGSNLVKTKAIHELFDATYGRLNSILGVELPFTSALTQTTIPMSFLDAPTEAFSDGETQIWKITHNGVDSHPVHFHLLNVQLVNRVDWAGIIMPPLPNELGWKETVKMNPLEDVIVAVRAKTPPLPGFGVPLSVRPMDPAQPLGSPFGFTQVDPTTGTPKTVVNEMMNYGWEYVWHCHILGHEENDFMRPIAFNAREGMPLAPTGVTGTQNGTQIAVKWTDASPASTVSAESEVGFRVQRSPSGLNQWTDLPGDLRPFKALGMTERRVNTLANATEYVDADLPAVAAGGAAPATPTSVTLSNVTTTSVRVNWVQPAQGANGVLLGYNVQRATVAADGTVGAFTTLNTQPLAATLSPTRYTDNTVQRGGVYRYRVVAVGEGNASLDYRVASVNVVGEVYSDPVTVGIGGGASAATSTPSASQAITMAAPTQNAFAYAGTGPYTVTYSWNAAANAASYSVRTRTGTTATNGTWTAFGAPQANLSFALANLAANSYVTFEVRATSPSGVVSASLTSTTVRLAVPTAPATPTLGAATANSLTFGWAATPSATGYTVDYATDTGFTAGLVTVPNVTALNHTPTTLLPNTRHYFRVKAVNAFGTGAASTAVNGWTLANPVAAAPTVSNLTGTTLTLNWVAPAVGGANRYSVQRSANGGATWTTLSNTTTATTYNVTGLSAGTSYQFRVLAQNGANVPSAASPVLSIATPVTVNAPTAVTAANGISGGVVTAGLNFTRNNAAAVTYELQFAEAATPAAFGAPIAITAPGQQVAVGGASRSLRMQVRAVSVDAAGNKLTSAWAPAAAVLVLAR
jgi:FtsP/CotA-like multicopper oxidase with cupredoxin domain/fibronectin type 3 domain-containing protein